MLQTPGNGTFDDLAATRQLAQSRGLFGARHRQPGGVEHAELHQCGGLVIVASSVVVDHAADPVLGVHQLETAVDLVEGQVV